ncbi:ParA family protein, partial [Streptomyces sp. NPDC003300]
MRTRRGRRLTRGLGPRRARGGVFAAAALTAAAALAGTGAGAATATAAPGDGVRDSAFAPVPDASEFRRSIADLADIADVSSRVLHDAMYVHESGP